MEDREIIALYNTRAESAIDATAEAYGEYCRAIAMRLLQNEEDVEECVNDAYLGAWNSIPPHQPQCLRTYLGRLTRNVACHKLERRTAVKRGGGEWDVMLGEMSECIPAESDTAGEVDALLLKETLDRFLDSLPADERWVLVHRCWYAESTAEIAASLGIREGTVRVMLHRTRKKLKAALNREGVTV